MKGKTDIHAGLTKNQSMVLQALRGADGPLSAYAILDLLREEGLKAPPQIYRALEKLTDQGLVHRLESLNAFVACRHPGCNSHETLVFMICEQCSQVGEFNDTELASQLTGLAGRRDFLLKKTTIELRGVCASCQAEV